MNNDMDYGNYKKYVKPKLLKEFIKMCEKNSHDFYSSSCITTAHIVMNDLMRHTYKDDSIGYEKKVSPKEAWKNGIKGGGHSGMSAAITATIIAKYSPRGKEFESWCIKDDVVMVDWGEKKRKKKSR